MDRANRVAQLYGYTVCLVAVVTLLFAFPSVINSLFRLSDPLQAENTLNPFFHRSTHTRPHGSEAAALLGRKASSLSRRRATLNCVRDTKR